MWEMLEWLTLWNGWSTYWLRMCFERAVTESKSSTPTVWQGTMIKFHKLYIFAKKFFFINICNQLYKLIIKKLSNNFHEFRSKFDNFFLKFRRPNLEFKLPWLTNHERDSIKILKFWTVCYEPWSDQRRGDQLVKIEYKSLKFSVKFLK